MDCPGKLKHLTTKGLAVREKVNFEEVFEVVTPESKVIRAPEDQKAMLTGANLGFPYCVLRPVPKRDLTKYRELYEAEKAAKKSDEPADKPEPKKPEKKD